MCVLVYIYNQFSGKLISPTVKVKSVLMQTDKMLPKHLKNDLSWDCFSEIVWGVFDKEFISLKFLCNCMGVDVLK